MQEALVLVCSRALAAAGEEPGQGGIMGSLQEHPRLLGWYTEELLKSLRREIAGSAQWHIKVSASHFF